MPHPHRKTSSLYRICQKKNKGKTHLKDTLAAKVPSVKDLCTPYVSGTDREKPLLVYNRGV